jgi:D-3-phosphoglycerate dehydrogenase
MRILNVEPEGYSPKATAILDKLGSVDQETLSREELISRIGDYDVLIVRLGHKIDAQVLANAHKLKAIVTATTGLNHIDLDAAHARGIEVLSLRGERAFLDTITATAEHAFALLLSLVRHIPQATADVIAGHWNRDDFKGRELRGQTLGIYGYGRLGCMVARYALAFGMNVVACDTHATTADENVRLVSRDEMLAQADIISIHLNYTSENHKIIDEEFFSSMRDGAVFINTARGELVDEAALLNALNNKKISAAALDVLQGENSGDATWMAHDPLIAYARKNDNLLLTPHIGGATTDSMEKTEIFMAEKLAKYLVGKAV